MRKQNYSESSGCSPGLEVPRISADLVRFYVLSYTRAWSLWKGISEPGGGVLGAWILGAWRGQFAAWREHFGAWRGCFGACTKYVLGAIFGGSGRVMFKSALFRAL